MRARLVKVSTCPYKGRPAIGSLPVIFLIMDISTSIPLRGSLTYKSLLSLRGISCGFAPPAFVCVLAAMWSPAIVPT